MKTGVSRADRIARGVTYVVNPLIVPPLLFAAVLVQLEAPVAETVLVTSTLLMLLTVLPSGFLWWMVRRGRAASVELLDRRERRAPFAFGILCTLAALGSIGYLVETARPLMLAVGICLVANTVLLAAINLRWKISVHSAAVGGFVAVVFFTNHLVGSGAVPALVVSSTLAVPMVMWARVRLGSHTPAQATGGAAFGLLVPLIELYALAAAGIL